MKISVDGLLLTVQPDQVNWQEPEILGRDGNAAPIFTPYWKCALSLSRVTSITHADWFALKDGELHTFILPHPATGVATTFTAYVDSVVGRFDTRNNCPVMIGADVLLSKITVTV